VALKTLIPGALESPELLKRFYREAQAAGSLEHPNIVTVYDLGEANGLPYIAMEFVQGESLDKIISRRPQLTVAHKLKILTQLCRALAYAHSRGIVHRDVKPGNILVKDDGTVKVVDFGIVHLAATGMTLEGAVLGTFSYMSPEQVRGETVDTRSDIFSVGLVMYELLAYRKAFDGPNLTAVML
jgi:serine/threonine protein kinase